MRHLFVYILGLYFLTTSCGQTDNTAQHSADTIKNGNTSTTFSTDTSKLGQLLNLKTCRPTSVKFKYIFHDNSGQNDRIAVPGPSDSYLQAILFYDSLTFQRLKTIYTNANHEIPNFHKEEFNFDWLDSGVQDELMKSDMNYHGHSNFLGARQLWFLDKKVLVIKSSN